MSGDLNSSALALIASSLFTNINELFELEKVYEEISYQANVVDERYFPGFFSVMAQK